MKKKTPVQRPSKRAAKPAKSSGRRPDEQKRPSLFERLKEAVEEMCAIERGEALPSRVWEVFSDGKGGFIRLQVDPADFRGARQRMAALQERGGPASKDLPPLP